MEKVAGPLVVLGRREEGANNRQEHSLEPGALGLGQAGVIHRYTTHQDELDHLLGPRSFDRLAEPHRRLGDEITGPAKHPLEADHVTKA